MTLPFRAADELAQRNFEELERRIAVLEQGVTAYGCKLYVASALTVPSAASDAAAYAVPWDSEEYDTHGFHDTSTNPSRITIPAKVPEGIWRLEGHIRLSTGLSAGTKYSALIFKNGTQIADYVTSPSSSSIPETVPFLVEVEMTRGDYLEVKIVQNSGSNATSTTGARSMVAFLSFIGG